MQIFYQGHSGVAGDREGYLMLSPLQLLWWALPLGSDQIARQQQQQGPLKVTDTEPPLQRSPRISSSVPTLFIIFSWAFHSPSDSSL